MSSCLSHRLRAFHVLEQLSGLADISRFGTPLQRRRPHEPPSRSPCRPSPGAVTAGGHSGGRSSRKCPPRIDKKASKRGEHSDFQSGDQLYLGILHISILHSSIYYASFVSDTIWVFCLNQRVNFVQKRSRSVEQVRMKA